MNQKIENCEFSQPIALVNTHSKKTDKQSQEQIVENLDTDGKIGVTFVATAFGILFIGRIVEGVINRINRSRQNDDYNLLESSFTYSQNREQEAKSIAEGEEQTKADFDTFLTDHKVTEENKQIILDYLKDKKYDTYNLIISKLQSSENFGLQDIINIVDGTVEESESV